ncbi:MAG: hypothetical protein RI932_2646 [Pseudomonadota bacterium]|jgi:hypothetical protein
MIQKTRRFPFFLPVALILVACGSNKDAATGTPFVDQVPNEKPATSTQDAQVDKDAEMNLAPKVALSAMRSEGTSIDTLAVMDYQNADFVQTIRCSARFTLRTPLGFNARDASGAIAALSAAEMRAVWYGALSDTTHCRMLGERMMRTSFSDPFAASGTYFYVFNPCRSSEVGNNGVSCSFQLTTTNNINLSNTLNEEKLRLMNLLMAKEAQLASVTLRFRSKLMVALEAQKRCEGNAAVDAVKEARTKALASLLGAGVAAAIGGVIAGPSSAVLLAQQALHWIAQYYGPGTQANPSSCLILKDAEAEAQVVGTEIEALRKEIGQIQMDLANL